MVLRWHTNSSCPAMSYEYVYPFVKGIGSAKNANLTLKKSKPCMVQVAPQMLILTQTDNLFGFYTVNRRN